MRGDHREEAAARRRVTRRAGAASGHCCSAIRAHRSAPGRGRDRSPRLPHAGLLAGLHRREDRRCWRDGQSRSPLRVPGMYRPQGVARRSAVGAGTGRRGCPKARVAPSRRADDRFSRRRRKKSQARLASEEKNSLGWGSLVRPRAFASWR